MPPQDHGCVSIIFLSSSFTCSLHHVCACAWLTPNLMVLKLVSAKGSHTGFDASRPQGNKHQPHHRQSTEGNTHTYTSANTHLCCLLLMSRRLERVPLTYGSSYCPGCHPCFYLLCHGTHLQPAQPVQWCRQWTGK